MVGDGGECLSGFTDVSVVLRCGIYVLRRNGVVVYVGQSKALLSRIYTHRNLARKKTPSWLKTVGIVFDEVFVMPCHPDRLDATERELIERFRPRHNIADKPWTPTPTTPRITRRPCHDSSAQPTFA